MAAERVQDLDVVPDGEFRRYSRDAAPAPLHESIAQRRGQGNYVDSATARFAARNGLKASLSSARPMPSREVSLPPGPSSSSPTGKPDRVSPTGTESPGMPAFPITSASRSSAPRT